MNKYTVFFLGLSLAMAYAEEASVGVSTSHMYKVNASTDILGRHNSKVANTPKTFVATPKKNSALMRSYNEDVVIEASSGGYEKYKVNGTNHEKYWFNNNDMDSATYVLNAALYDARFANRINFQGINYVNYNYFNAIYSYSKEKNKYYGQEKYIQDNKDGSREYFYNINTLIRENDIYYDAIAKKERGQGIGVYVAESAQPNRDEAKFTPIYTCPDRPSGGSIHHVGMITKIINHLASEATVYTVDRGCLSNQDDVYPTRPDLYSPDPIYIGNHSYGLGSDAYYENKVKFVDDYVYNTRVIEVASAGNSAKLYNKNVSPTGRGMNVITVGAANRLESGEYAYDDETSIKNPRLKEDKFYDYDKPEIINMANVFFNKGATYTYNYNGANSFPPIFDETSSATPYTVGMIADLLHQKPFYKWHPEVVKALLLTSSVMSLAHNTHQQEDIDSNTNKLIGRGMPLYSAMIDGNRSRYWLGNKDDFFKNEQIIFEEPNITAGNTYRIAIAWLVEGKYLLENKEIAQDFDLRVSQPGSTDETSYSYNNPFEMVEFTAKNNKNLTITINRFHNRGNNRVMLGYNLYEVPKKN